MIGRWGAVFSVRAGAARPYGVGLHCLAAKAKDARADVAALEREIDAIVYRLYSLSADEITVAEEGVSPA